AGCISNLRFEICSISQFPVSQNGPPRMLLPERARGLRGPASNNAMYLRLLRDTRDFRLLYAGTLISLGGDWFLTVALLDLVLQLTGSATLASLMLLCQTPPILFVNAHARDARARP